MPITKKSNTLNPKSFVQISSDFNYPYGLKNTSDISETLVSNRSETIQLYFDDYIFNSNLTCSNKYVKGLISQSKNGYINSISKITLLNDLKISGECIFENLYIFSNGKSINLANGSKLILKNCYINFASNFDFNCIDALNSTLIIENSRIIASRSGIAITGNNVFIINSYVESFKFLTSSGSLNLTNSYVNNFICPVQLSKDFVLNAENSTFPIDILGILKVNINDCVIKESFQITQKRGYVGLIKNTVLNNLYFYNQFYSDTWEYLIFKNCVFNRISGGGYFIIDITGGTPIIYFDNCFFLKGTNYYGLTGAVSLNSASAVLYFFNSVFRLTYYRFAKYGSGNNRIKTYFCVGNYSDYGFSSGEITDYQYILDTNL